MRNGLDPDFKERETRWGEKLAIYGYFFGVILVLVLVLWATMPHLNFLLTNLFSNLLVLTK